MSTIIEEVIGKVHVTKLFRVDGSQEAEKFSVPGKMMLHRDFDASGSIEETYIVARKIVDAKAYEKARKKYPDMPKANPEGDHVGKVLAGCSVSEGRTAERADLSPEEIEELKREAVLAESFLTMTKPCLWGLSHRETSSFLGDLDSVSKEIWIIGVEHLPDGFALAGGVLVRLGDDPECRKKALDMLSSVSVSGKKLRLLDSGQDYEVLLE